MCDTVRADTEVLVMPMGGNNSRNSNKQWDTVEVTDHRITLNRRIKDTKVISNLQITVRPR